jgi:membrane protein implicated in regulation of membrane protease activity
MEQATVWWVLAGAMVALELATGTFYLLMISIGVIAGALAAHAGVPLAGQIVSAALVGGGAVVGWNWRRSMQPKAASANANADVLIDIGELVQVEHWEADGTAVVKHRGANWTAIMAVPNETTAPGQFRIVQMMGNRLMLEKS